MLGNSFSWDAIVRSCCYIRRMRVKVYNQVINTIPRWVAFSHRKKTENTTHTSCTYSGRKLHRAFIVLAVESSVERVLDDILYWYQIIVTTKEISRCGSHQKLSNTEINVVKLTHHFLCGNSWWLRLFPISFSNYLIVIVFNSLN